MEFFCIYNAQAVFICLKIRRYFFYHRFFRILEINVNQAAYRTSHLIHQTAWLSKINIFCKLSCLGNQNRADTHIIKQTGKYGSDNDFKSCRGRQTCANKHITGNIGFKSTQLISSFFQICRHTSD